MDIPRETDRDDAARSSVLRGYCDARKRRIFGRRRRRSGIACTGFELTGETRPHFCPARKCIAKRPKSLTPAQCRLYKWRATASMGFIGPAWSSRWIWVSPQAPCDEGPPSISLRPAPGVRRNFRLCNGSSVGAHVRGRIGSNSRGCGSQAQSHVPTPRRIPHGIRSFGSHRHRARDPIPVGPVRMPRGCCGQSYSAQDPTDMGDRRDPTPDSADPTAGPPRLLTRACEGYHSKDSRSSEKL
jgi:hypothetical protein